MTDTDAQLTEEERKNWEWLVKHVRAYGTQRQRLVGELDNLAILAVDARLRWLEEERDREARVIVGLLAEAEAEE